MKENLLAPPAPAAPSTDNQTPSQVFTPPTPVNPRGRSSSRKRGAKRFTVSRLQGWYLDCTGSGCSRPCLILPTRKQQIQEAA